MRGFLIYCFSTYALTLMRVVAGALNLLLLHLFPLREAARPLTFNHIILAQ